MTKTHGDRILEKIETNEWYALKMDGFDSAITGYVFYKEDDQVQLVYRYDACIAALMSDGMTEVSDGMTEDEAMEYFEFNCLGSLMGWSEDIHGGPPPLILYD